MKEEPFSNYLNRARKLDEDKGFHNGEDGPFTKTFIGYGVEGRQVVAPAVGAFAEMPFDLSVKEGR